MVGRYFTYKDLEEHRSSNSSPRCTTLFRVSCGSIGGGVGPSDTNETHGEQTFLSMSPLRIEGPSEGDFDIRYFRRFRVLMDVLRQTACVLVAEDNPIARQLLVKQLQRLQLHVIATGNGEEALAEWNARGPGYFSAALFDQRRLYLL
ncbi:hypothetical protein H0H92_000385 [Tricholoma furcatifolium]|nr:hypothetical protein H0H92_000385 [Tricholoma furcatifolium]